MLDLACLFFFFLVLDYQLRGAGRNNVIIMCDEFAKFRLNRFFENVVPNLALANSILICASSKGDADNPMEELYDSVDPDTAEYIFTVIDLQRICKNCKLAGKQTCSHGTTERPAWQDAYSFNRVKALFTQHQAMFRQEMDNEDGESQIFDAFDKLSIEASIRKENTTKIEHKIPFILVCVDPSDAGFDSDYAVVSLACMYKHFQVRIEQPVIFYIYNYHRHTHHEQEDCAPS